ncbi:SPOR domain-containing protein [Sphingomonas gilva]|nr:SPOR domain-containing protein [Sphingomonas gilva]
MSIALTLFLALAAASQQKTPEPVVKQGVEAWERGEFKAATDMWRSPAIAGDADAQFNLGQAYKLGRGVPADLRQAEDWYRRAALQGHTKAQDNYGLLLYQNGRRKEAMPVLETSANRGEPRAQYVYGTELFNGELVAKDWVRAYAMMTRASTAGIPRASENLAQMDRFIPAPERQKGIELARTMERTPSRAQIAAVAPEEAAIPAPKPAAPVATKPKPAPRPPVAGGPWRVQLGAFSETGRARSAWSDLSGKVAALDGLEPDYVKAGPITRLQARGLSSSAAASAVCAKVKASGGQCLVVKP